MRCSREGVWQVAGAAGVGVGALLVYLLTMYPDLAGGDSGELVAAVASGGVIHPPGYPLYSLLGRLFIHFPAGTLAWRMALMSAVCDALAAAVLCYAVARWSRSAWAGVAAGGLFALAPGIWHYAIQAEVFALNNLMVALLVLFAVLHSETRQRRYALAGALVLGFGLANHHTIVFVGVPFALWILWRGWTNCVARGCWLFWPRASWWASRPISIFPSLVCIMRRFRGAPPTPGTDSGPMSCAVSTARCNWPLPVSGGRHH